MTLVDIVNLSTYQKVPFDTQENPEKECVCVCVCVCARAHACVTASLCCTPKLTEYWKSTTLHLKKQKVPFGDP